MNEIRTKTTISLSKYYQAKKKRIIILPIRLINELKPKIIQIDIGKNSTKLKMAPEWFQYNNQENVLKNIIYPLNINDNEEDTIKTIARYRSSIHQEKTNFIENPIDIGEQQTETLIIALNDFIKEFNGELTFTDENITFTNPTYRTACGIADLSSAHLLATDYIPTAKFSFLIHLDYQSDLARSIETMQNFTLEFSKAISTVIDCPNDYIRIISIEKLSKFRRKTKVNFGLTTPNSEQTEQLAQHLKIKAQNGFPKDRILKYIIPDDYEYQWKPLITFFQLQSTDFTTNFNNDYRNITYTREKRANLPYYLPIGWYRHALNVIDKYPQDKLWLGSSNIHGEWAVAFHGTKGQAVKGIAQQGLLINKVIIDAKRKEAVENGGSYFDKPGLYVATHCTGGAHPQYTQPFDIITSSKDIDKFRVVFQCRVKPGVYTTHQSPVNKGKAWRFVDADAIRPYGILIKSEQIPDVDLEDIQDD